MQYIHRKIQEQIEATLKRGKSVLLLGPRQTGKTTLLKKFEVDLTLSFLVRSIRQRYERQNDLLLSEVQALSKKLSRPALIVLDEIQKVPALLDTVQYAIDEGVAKFILTGSSARKLKRNHEINLLPGRLVQLRLDPFSWAELPESDIHHLLLYGSLPAILNTSNDAEREIDLENYVETYLEEEVRSEALVRNTGTFNRFLELAGIESGEIVNFREISKDLGISHTTVASYFEILEDCLIAERIDPITNSSTRKKLTRSSRYLIFDMGVRRACAREGTRLLPVRLGKLFEQYIGLELLRNARLMKKTTLKFWRDPDGPEVDWVLDKGGTYVPIEVKWSESPRARDAKHLATFLTEYKNVRQGYIVCRTPRRYQILPNVDAIPWQELETVYK